MYLFMFGSSGADTDINSQSVFVMFAVSFCFKTNIVGLDSSSALQLLKFSC